MPLPRLFSSCFRTPNDADLVALPPIQPSLVNVTSPGGSAPLAAAVSVAGRIACASKDADVPSLLERNIPYTPKTASQRPSLCFELRQPSVHPEPRSKVEYTSADELVKDVQNLRWLGQGAQGVVYEGIWQGATVAVKFSVVENLDATAYELLFSRLLSHPNVVQTFVAKVAVLDERTIHPPQDGCGQEAAGLGPGAAAGSAAADEVKRRDGGATAATALYRPGATSTEASGGGDAAAAGHIPAVIAGCGGSGAAAAATAAADFSLHGGCCAAGREELPRSGALGLSRSHHHSSHQSHHQSHSHPRQHQQSQQPQSLQHQPLARADSFQSDDGFGNPFGRRCTFSDVREVLATMGARPGHFIAQMVMEHCDHGSLHAAIQRGIFKPTSRWGPKLALRALIRTVREVAQGMFHLHSNNVLHGDLKPANVLLINSRKDRRGYVAKVSDFGMAQFCPQDHISNAPWGTLVYMAPERLLKGHLFPASDVYSFGVILWEMYHGQRPYEGMHAAQIVMACAQGCACLEWSQDSCPEIVRISRACMTASLHDRPSFEWLMHELAALEARVRTDGVTVRVSKSMDAGGSGTRSVSRTSSDAAAPPSLHRARAVSGLPGHSKRSFSLEATAQPFARPAAAATATAAATEPATASRSSSKDAAAAAAGAGTLAGVRRSADVCCHAGAHGQAHNVQPPSCGGNRPPPAPVAPPPRTHAMVAATAAGTDGPIGAVQLPPGGAVSVFGPGGAGGCSGGSLVTAVDVDAGRGNSCSAAAIAATLAQQPGLASAVVSELLALRLQQQQQQSQQPQLEQQQQLQQQQPGQQQQQSPGEQPPPPPPPPQRQPQQAEADTAVWAAAAAAASTSRHTGGAAAMTAAPRRSSCGGGGDGDLWRRSSSGLGCAAAAAPSQASQPATPTTCGPSRLPGRSPSPGRGGSQRASRETSPAAPRGLSPPSLLRSCSCGCSSGGRKCNGGPVALASGSASASSSTAPGAAAAACRGDAGASSVASEAAAPPSPFVTLPSLSPSSSWRLAVPNAYGLAAADDIPVSIASNVMRDVISLQQQQGQPAGCAVGTAAPLVRRRSSGLSVARRSSKSKAWECPTIKEEPQ